jgi:hypothetical protein
MYNPKTGRDDTILILYQAFVRQREQTGYPYLEPLTKRIQIWSVMAKFVDGKGWDPATFVVAQFRALPEHLRRGLTPNQIWKPIRNGGEQVMTDNYLRMSPGAAGPLCQIENTMIEMDQHLRHLATELMPRYYATLEDLLADGGYAFEPWFRILAAPRVTEVLEYYFGQRARQEYAENPTLRKYLEDNRERFNIDLSRLQRPVGPAVPVRPVDPPGSL